MGNYGFIIVYGLQQATSYADTKLIVRLADFIGASLIVCEPTATIFFQKEPIYKRVLEELDAKRFELTESATLDENRIEFLNAIGNHPNANSFSSVKKQTLVPAIQFVDGEKEQFLNVLEDLDLSEPTVIVAYHQEGLNIINQQLQQIKINAMMGFDNIVETRSHAIIFEFLLAATCCKGYKVSFDSSFNLLFKTIMKLLPYDDCTASDLKKWCVMGYRHRFLEADDLAEAKEIYDAFIAMMNVRKPEYGIHLLLDAILPRLKKESANIRYYCDFIVDQLKPYDTWREVNCKLLHPKLFNNPVHLSTSSDFEHFDNKNVILVNLIPGRISQSLAHYHTEYEQHIATQLFYNCVAHATKTLTLIYRKDFYKPIEANDPVSLTRGAFYNRVEEQLNPTIRYSNFKI